MFNEGCALCFIRLICMKGFLVALAIISNVHDETTQVCFADCRTFVYMQLTVNRLSQWMSDKLASYKCPRDVKIVEELPRNAMGKINKKVLQKQIPQ